MQYQIGIKLCEACMVYKVFIHGAKI